MRSLTRPNDEIARCPVDVPPAWRARTCRLRAPVIVLLMTASARTTSQAALGQPPPLRTLFVEGGLAASFDAGRRGRATSSPPQLGHLPANTSVAHDAQKVHSKEQMYAPLDPGGKSRSQHSQFGLSSSITVHLLSRTAVEPCSVTSALSGAPRRPAREARANLFAARSEPVATDGSIPCVVSQHRV